MGVGIPTEQVQDALQQFSRGLNHYKESVRVHA
jgi:hypothetical protein